MGRPRKPGNKKLPRGLYVSSGYYRYKVKGSGEEIGLGRNKAAAIKFAIDANLEIGMPPFRRRDVPMPDPIATLLSAEEIARAARPVLEAVGIYFLLLEQRVVYVGQSIACHRRVYEHSIDQDKRFDAYFVLPAQRDLLDVLETAYILKFKPPFNTVVPGYPRAVRQKFE